MSKLVDWAPKYVQPGLTAYSDNLVVLHKIFLKWQKPQLCTEPSEVLIGLVSSHTTGVTLPVWLEGDLALISACQRSVNE